MAEYMTREQAIEILNRDDSEMRKGYFCINDFNAIEVLKTANVVEREKIDKAIEEAYKMRNEVLYANGCYEPNDVLDIIDQITKLFEEI